MDFRGRERHKAAAFLDDVVQPEVGRSLAAAGKLSRGEVFEGLDGLEGLLQRWCAGKDVAVGVINADVEHDSSITPRRPTERLAGGSVDNQPVSTDPP